MDQIQKIINSKARAIAGEKKKVDLNLVVEVSDDSDFEDVLVTKAIAKDVKPIRKVNRVLKLEDRKKKLIKQDSEVISMISQKKLKKKRLRTININDEEILRIPAKVVIRDEDDIVKEMCSKRHKGNEVQPHLEDEYYASRLSYQQIKKQLRSMYLDIDLFGTLAKSDVFLKQAGNIWRKIKCDRYIKTIRAKEIRTLLERNDQLDILLNAEREERKKLQKKLNDLKKLLS